VSKLLTPTNQLDALVAMPHPGDALRQWRIDWGWTQSELAERSGVTQGDISRIENHQLDARWSTIHRLTAALSTDSEKPKRSLANGGRSSAASSGEIGKRKWTPKSRVLPITDGETSARPEQ
jgi:transcriptional regulator with XRE-family HTH domain